MSKKRHAINIPGVILDSIRDNTDYETDERFTKRQKIKSSVLNRKENRKQNRLNKKNQKRESKIQHKENYDANIKMQNKNNNNNNNHRVNTKNKKSKKKNENRNIVRIKDPKENEIKINKSGIKKKNIKRVSFSDHDDIREIPSRNSTQPNIDLDFEKWEKEFTSDSEDTDDSFSEDQNDSQDEKDENDAHNLIETLKHLKQVQRGEYSDNINKNDNSSSEEEEEEEEDNTLNDIESENLDDRQKDVMNQLARLKANKGNNSKNKIRIVKEDDLSDDSFSEDDGIESESESDNEFDVDLDDEQKSVMDQLKKIKGSKVINNDIKIIKEDDINDDSISEEDEEEKEEIPMNDNEDLDFEQKNIMKQLAALKSKKNNKPSNNSIRIVKEDELSDADEVSVEDESDFSFNSEEEMEEENHDEDHVMKKLAILKKNNKTKSTPLKIVKEDELDDESLSSESNNDEFDEYNEENEIEDYDSPTIFNSKEDNDLDYYAKKLGIQSKSKLKQQDDNDLIGGLFDGLDFIEEYNNKQEEKEEKRKSKELKKKEEKSKKESKIKENKEKKNKHFISDYDKEMPKKDDDDISYYAKKLGIDPKKSLTKQDDDDIIGGLFDGIDLDFSNNKDNEGSFTESDESEKDTKENNKLRGDKEDEDEDDNDAINSEDFDDDDDLDDDDKALLREMYGLESSEESDSEFDSDNSDDGRPRVKENPYIAPVESNVEDSNSVPGSKYIPPALRKKMALGKDTGDSEELKKIMRLIKGPFNKLSEPNIINVISELNNLYNDNPRQFVNEAILKVVIQSVSISTPMLESFLVLYASAIVAIYKLQGVEFGAFIIQHIVEIFEKDIESESRSKQEIINITGLLGYLYTLNLINSTLIYDIIKVKLIKNPTELKTDVLLKLIKSCGSKLRTDDSTALNSIILELTKSVKENEKLGIKTSTRSRFLIDTITDLKNNRLKNSENENTTLMINRLKKQLGSINNSRNLEPIKVNLEDIENIEERGKWWLVGSAWKGNNDNLNKNAENLDNDEEIDLTNVNDNMEDELLGGLDVNWLELAKQCRMNTDIRRAIFISIMSADDFMDAFMKLEKLNLKKSQKAEIPNILMHCATMESIYNPYYSYLAKKLSDDHLMRRSFQLNLWDFIKELDGEESSTTILLDADDDQRLWKILNMGRFFGFLIGEGSLSLNVLRTVNFLTASSDVKIFLEILLITVLDVIAKKSEVVISNDNNKSSKYTQYNNKIMSDRVSKCDEQQLLIKGLQYFLNNKVNKSKFIKGKKQRGRIEWGIDAMSEFLSEILKAKA